jgi:hypothetical protein
MSQIGTLVTGAGVVTTINQNWVPQYILVGNTETALPITNVSYQISGEEKLNLTGQALIQALSKFGKQPILGATLAVAQVLQIADGYYGNLQFQLRLTNAGATTPAIYGFSERWGEGRCIAATNVVILATSNQSFQGFLALAFDPTNVNTIDLSWMDRETGKEYQESGLVANELEAFFNIENPSDDNGQLAAVTVIDNRLLVAQRGKFITKARIFNGAGGTTSVEVVGLKNV